MRKRSSNAKPQQAKGKKKGSPLSTPNQRGGRQQQQQQCKSPPSATDPLAFLSSAAASSSATAKKGRKLLSPVVSIAIDLETEPSPKIPASVADLRSLVASRTESLKRHLDQRHSDVMNELDALHTRISKRFKSQSQACLNLTADIDKEYKKMSDRIVENTERIKGSYKEFIEEAQSAAARLCKVSFSDLAKSTEKSLNDLRARYKIPTAL